MHSHQVMRHQFLLQGLNTVKQSLIWSQEQKAFELQFELQLQLSGSWCWFCMPSPLPGGLNPSTTH